MYNKKSIQKLISRPEALNPADLEEETIDDALQQKVESPLEEPEQMLEEEPAEQELLASGEEDTYTPDPEILAALKKLRAGEGLEDQEVAKETIEDTEAPLNLRKEAIRKIKQKYLGE